MQITNNNQYESYAKRHTVLCTKYPAIFSDASRTQANTPL